MNQVVSPMNVLIEKYIRYPQLLTDQEKSDVQQLLSQSEAAKKWYNWLCSFYKELDLQKDAYKTEEAIVFQLFKPRAIQLDQELPHAVKLAAKTGEILKTHLFTLVSEESELAVRFFYHKSENQYYAYLINPQKTKNSVSIRFKKTGKELVFGPSSCITWTDNSKSSDEFSVSDIELLHKR